MLARTRRAPGHLAGRLNRAEADARAGGGHPETLFRRGHRVVLSESAGWEKDRHVLEVAEILQELDPTSPSWEPLYGDSHSAEALTQLGRERIFGVKPHGANLVLCELIQYFLGPRAQLRVCWLDVRMASAVTTHRLQTVDRVLAI